MGPISEILKPLSFVCLLLLTGLPSYVGSAQTINMPARNNSPGFEVRYSTCEATFYDSGGIDVYGNNENGIVTFCPATAGDRIRMRFTMANIKANDSLKVYNGPSDDAPILATITNIFSLPDPLEVSASQANPEGCLTVTFRSRNLTFANVYDGWVASVSCFTPEIEPGIPMDLFRNDDPSGDGLEIFDLRENDLPILNGLSQPEYEVRYFSSQADAENNTNPLDPIHTNTGNPQTIYTRLQSTVTDYFAVNSFEIFVNPIPDITSVPELVSCGEPGEAPFFLADRFPEIYNGREGLLAVFFESPEALSANTAPVDPETEYTTRENPQRIYYRLIDTSTGAYAIGDFLIRTEPAPVVATPAPRPVCGNGAGEALVNLLDFNQELLGGQTGLEVTYHVNLSEAEDGLNPLATEIPIRSDLESYARVTDPRTGCATVVPVRLEFQPAAQTTLRETYLLCPSPEDNQLPSMILLETGLDPSAYEFSWFLNNEVLPGENGPVLQTNLPGDYEVSIIRRVGGCTSVATTVVQFAEPPASLDISLNPDGFGSNYEVLVNAQGDYPYTFRLDERIGDTSGTFQNILPGTHFLSVFTEDGCRVLTREFQIFGYPP
ncbi:MAG: hypothetical protein R3252_06485, partial [Robiginitalea sp.]|nr:hypothetical protein [Robiginitalea sp.]